MKMYQEIKIYNFENKMKLNVIKLNIRTDSYNLSK